MSGRGESARGDRGGRGGRGGHRDSGNVTLEQDDDHVHDDTIREETVDEEETGVDDEAEANRLRAAGEALRQGGQVLAPAAGNINIDRPLPALPAAGGDPPPPADPLYQNQGDANQ